MDEDNVMNNKDENRNVCSYATLLQFECPMENHFLHDTEAHISGRSQPTFSRVLFPRNPPFLSKIRSIYYIHGPFLTNCHTHSKIRYPLLLPRSFLCHTYTFISLSHLLSLQGYFIITIVSFQIIPCDFFQLVPASTLFHFNFSFHYTLKSFQKRSHFKQYLTNVCANYPSYFSKSLNSNTSRL